MTLTTAMERQETKLDSCVHCGFCLPACPTYTRLGDEADSPRGRLYLMRAAAEGRLDAGSDSFQTHIDRCLGCRACETVCPSGVEYGLLLEGARAAALEAKPPGALTRMLLGVFARKWLAGPLMTAGAVFRATGLPALAARRLPAGSVRTAMAMLAGSSSADLAMRAGGASAGPGPGTVWSRRREPEVRTDNGVSWTDLDPEATPPPSTIDDSGPAPEKIRYAGMLTGCVQAGLFGRVNRATRRVLEANSVRVMPVGGQGCCGALHAHAGDLETARTLARNNIQAFERAGVEWIIVNSAGCGSAMKEYGHLLADDLESSHRARAVAEKVLDITEMLESLGPRVGGQVELTVSYDAPCHLRHAQRVTEAPVSVMDSIPGLTVIPLASADECCGGAGIYGLTHADLGAQIGDDKVDGVVAAGASVVATGNPGCMMQIGAGLQMRGSRIQVAHPVELLDLSYERAGYYKRK